ncbi:RnfH family protein [Kingella kingae]|uniref:RnfH family protein n=1 Tax=Kingella kingae TaxID=504 RepID=UPI0003F7BE49|nr:RnfH family protein [Kingella kingae]
MDKIAVEVAYGTATQQKLYRLHLAAGCTARNDVLAAPILHDFPDADVQAALLGIFGKAVKDDTVLRDGDRVEVYRPLLADPKDARRKRVAQKK